MVYILKLIHTNTLNGLKLQSKLKKIGAWRNDWKLTRSIGSQWSFNCIPMAYQLNPLTEYVNRSSLTCVRHVLFFIFNVRIDLVSVRFHLSNKSTTTYQSKWLNMIYLSITKTHTFNMDLSTCGAQNTCLMCMPDFHDTSFNIFVENGNYALTFCR